MKRLLLASTVLGVVPCSAQTQTCDLTFNGAAFGCVSPTYHVSQFGGATVGDRILACVNALPSVGGVCDARDIPTGGVIPSITLSKSGATILGPCGLFTLTGSINITGVSAFRWEGCGASFGSFGTKFVWGGNAIDPAMRLRGVSNSEIGRLAIASNEFVPLAEAIRFETLTGLVSTHRRLYQIIINGTAPGGLGIPIRWCAGNNCGGSGTDSNNDLDTIDDVIVSNYTNCGYSIEGTQAVGISFNRAQFNANRVGNCGVQTTIGGSFNWHDGGGGGSLVADFVLGAPNQAITISGFTIEDSNRLMIAGSSPSAVPWPISINGGRWAANLLNADNSVIINRYAGPLNITGLQIDGAQIGAAPQFNLVNGTATAIGVTVRNQAATSLTNPFVGGTWSLLGNTVSDNAGNLYQVPNK